MDIMEAPPKMSRKGNEVIFGSCRMSISVGMISAWLESGTRTCNVFVCWSSFLFCCICWLLFGCCSRLSLFVFLESR